MLSVSICDRKPHRSTIYIFCSYLYHMSLSALSAHRPFQANSPTEKLLAQLKGSEHDNFVEQIKAQLQQAKRFSYGKQVGAIEKLVNTTPSASFPHATHNQPPSQLDTSAVATPPLLTEDPQSPQTSSLPSTNTSTVDGPTGDRKPSAGLSVDTTPTNSL